MATLNTIETMVDKLLTKNNLTTKQGLDLFLVPGSYLRYFKSESYNLHRTILDYSLIVAAEATRLAVYTGAGLLALSMIQNADKF